jgi:hypothetical protein
MTQSGQMKKIQKQTQPFEVGSEKNHIPKSFILREEFTIISATNHNNFSTF